MYGRDHRTEIGVVESERSFMDSLLVLQAVTIARKMLLTCVVGDGCRWVGEIDFEFSHGGFPKLERRKFELAKRNMVNPINPVFNHKESGTLIVWWAYPTTSPWRSYFLPYRSFVVFSINSFCQQIWCKPYCRISINSWSTTNRSPVLSLTPKVCIL